MRAHPKELEVQRSGCAGLYYLAKDLSQVVHDAGGPQAVMKAMEGHSKEVQVLQPGCAVMYCCATVEPKAVTDMGGSGAVGGRWTSTGKTTATGSCSSSSGSPAPEPSPQPDACFRGPSPHG